MLYVGIYRSECLYITKSKSLYMSEYDETSTLEAFQSLIA